VQSLGLGGYGQVRGMKVRSSVKKLCEGCKVRTSFFYLDLTMRDWDDGRVWE
jgi:hypothetical protein